MGYFFVVSLFAYLIYLGLTNPPRGLIGFYGWVILEPEWNWRWVVDSTGWQKWIFISVILGWLLSGARLEKPTRMGHFAVLALLAFLGIGYLSAGQTISVDHTTFYLGYMWKVVAAAVLATLIIKKPEDITLLMAVTAITQGYSAFRINEQYFQDGYSLYVYLNSWGFKGDNNLYSNLTIPCIAYSASLAVFSKNQLQKLLFGGITILQMHQIMILESRGAFLGSLLTSSIMLIIIPKTKGNLLALFVLLMVGSALAGPSVVDEFNSIFEDPAEGEFSSKDDRIEIWTTGWAITMDHFWLGVGPFAGQTLVPVYSDMYQSEKALHNLFLEISTGFGFPATVLYVAFMVIPWIYAIKSYLKIRNLNNSEPWFAAATMAMICGMPGYLLAAMFSSGALQESSYLLSVVSICVARVATQTNSIKLLNSQSSTTVVTRRTPSPIPPI